MTITIYSETHREACLDGTPAENLEADTAEYDKYIGHYITYLQGLAKEDEIEIETADRAAGQSYHADTDGEDFFMMTHVDFWEWYQDCRPNSPERYNTMGTLPIQGSPAEKQYRGCGKAWVAVNKSGEVVALRYMGDFDEETTPFTDHRWQSRKELADLGEVQSGMLSCYQFVPKAY